MTETIRGYLSAIADGTKLSAYLAGALGDESVIRLLTHNGLVSFLYPLVPQEIAVPGPKVRGFLREAHLNAQLHYDLAVAVLADLTPKFPGRIVLIQGMALAEACYDDPFARSLSDIDLFLPDGGMEDVKEFLRGEGFEPFRGYHSLWYRGGLALDLHTSPWGEDRIGSRRFCAPLAEFPIAPSASVKGCFIPQEASLVAHSCFHGVKHAFAKAVWTLDLVKLLSKVSVEDTLNNCLVRNSKTIEYALAHLASCRFGFVVSGPRGSFVPTITIPARLVESSREGWGEILLALACKKWRRTVLYFLETLVPKKSVLREMYGPHAYPTLLARRFLSLVKMVCR